MHVPMIHIIHMFIFHLALEIPVKEKQFCYIANVNYTCTLKPCNLGDSKI
jgi:hypothetical protein